MLNECTQTVSIRKILPEDIEPMLTGDDRQICNELRYGQSYLFYWVSVTIFPGKIARKDPQALKPTFVQE